jgi:glyoxylase-like metal-dependent hydrolase (beta-lactamase superfamily II)
MRRNPWSLLFVFVLAVVLGPLAAAQQTPAPAPPAQARQPARSITQITGDLYRASSGAWHGIFLVTPEGIILVDPLNTPFATWLKDQLAERFKVPVRYVIYSHSHWDHAEGGKVFADTARFVAQEGVRRNMDGRFPHMPGDMIDRNNNGQFEPEEFRIPAAASPGVCGGNFTQSKDIDRDGHLTPKEYFSEVQPPDIVYSDRMQLTLGGKTVELIYPGKNHSDDMTVVRFPAERVVFAADFLADALVTTTMRSLPSACGPFDGNPLSEWIKSYKTVEALDFDILAGGHGVLFKKADVVETRQYFEDLAAVVSAGMSQGKSLEELRQTIMIEKYKDWAQYARLRVKNIEAAYENLKLYRQQQ